MLVLVLEVEEDGKGCGFWVVEGRKCGEVEVVHSTSWGVPLNVMNTHLSS